MNFFTKKNFLFKLIVSICIVLAIMNGTGIQRVYAKEKSGIGGVLISPICDLLCALGDAIMDLLQKSIMGTEATVSLDNTKDGDWWKIFAAVVLVAIAVVVSVATFGLAAVISAITMTAIKVAIAYGALYLVTGGGINVVISAISGALFSDTVVLPMYTIGPEEIFSGKILLFDANIFNPKEVFVEYRKVDPDSGDPVSDDLYNMCLSDWNELQKDTDRNTGELQSVRYYYIKDGKQVETSTNNSAYELRDIISKWYYIIRSIALVGSMLVLLYVGIRMIISSVAAEKAKYKEMLMDWVVALCLIFLMHYIMIFAHSVVESITDIVSNTLDDNMQMAVIYEPEDALVESIQDLESKTGETYYNSDEKLINWPTNQMGRFRVEAQAKDGKVEYIGYTLAYLALVIYTFIFSVTYIKRLLYLLFLTVISPFVALTYPIDKINDGKAQAFDMWLKEYIFNLLIQPFHLLIYTIFVTMAYDLASKNVIYSLVVIGFIIPAEKFLRTMFGFNKASTPGMLAGAAGAALTMSAVKSFGNFAKGGRDEKGAGGKDQEKEKQSKLRTADSSHSQSALYASLAGSGNDEENDNGENDNGGNNIEDNKEKTTAQKMLDAYDEKFGTNEYDPAEREAMARAAYQPESMKYSAEEFRQILEDSGYEGEDLEQAMLDNGYGTQRGTSDERELTSPNNDDKPRKTGRAGRIARAGGRLALRGAKSVGSYTLKTGARLSMATTGAMLGAAAGIVSGDPSKAFQYTAAGATAGNAFAKGVTNRIPNSFKKSIDSYNRQKEAVQKDYYGADYSQHMRDVYDKQFEHDREIRRMYKEKLGLKGKQQVDDAMRDAVKYRQYGINDNDIIIKAMLSEDKGNPQNRASNTRIAAAKLAETSKTEKDLQTHMQRFAKTPGIKEKQVKDMERMVRGINNL